MGNSKRSIGQSLSIRTMAALWRRVRLAWRLFRDDRVSPAAKAIPILGLIYLIWPVDFLPDLFPALGQLDDIAVLLLALNWFIYASPGDVVKEIQDGDEAEVISARYKVIDKSEHQGS